MNGGLTSGANVSFWRKRIQQAEGFHLRLMLVISGEFHLETQIGSCVLLTDMTRTLSRPALCYSYPSPLSIPP